MNDIQNINYIIGVDISKNELDFAVKKEKAIVFHKEIRNTPDDIEQFLHALISLEDFSFNEAVFCMEHSGLYGNLLLEALTKSGARIVVENPIHIKRSMGLTREKHDKIDSIRIAHFAHKNLDELRLWVPKRPLVEQLMSLSTLRERLVTLSVMIKTPITDQKRFVNDRLQELNLESCMKTAAAVKSDLKKLDATLHKLIKGDEHLYQTYGLITSVPGVGPLTAIQIIITTNEFKNIKSPKKFACYSGVAPFKIESGLIVSKARVSAIANKRMKSLLYMCAMKAIKIDPEIRAYYLRKTVNEQKPKMLVLNAVKNKLILRVFACANQQKKFTPDYRNKLPPDNLVVMTRPDDKA